MEQPIYYSIPEMLEMLDQPHRDACKRIFHKHEDLFKQAFGSAVKHQAWPGGYYDHICETMNYVILHYNYFNKLRHYPFSLSDALLILFLHDIEKPWKYTFTSEKDVASYKTQLYSKQNQREFREKFIRDNGIQLTSYQLNALHYVEGEGDDYTVNGRVMNELAAICNIADIHSARAWYNYPQPNDPWKGAGRIQEI